MSDENSLMREIQIAASTLGARLFRQNAGQGWVGKAEKISREKSVTVRPGDVIVRRARPFHAGRKGMSDLGGWVPVLIQPEHVGQEMAVYLQAEVKAGARLTEEQAAWIDGVNRAGGIAGVVRSYDDLAALIGAKSGSRD